MTSRRIAAILFLVALGAIGAVYALSPTLEERISMLVRDGRQREALLELNKAFASGVGSSANLLTMARLQEAAGDYSSAAETTEMFLLLHPEDVSALGALVARYTALGRSLDLTDALGRLVLVEPTRESIARLLALLRVQGNFRRESEVLEQLESSPLLSADDLSRLGALLAADGRYTDAVRALRRADELATGDAEIDRTFLLELLLRTGDWSTATERAERWLTQWRKPWLAVRLALRLAEAAPHDNAVTIARVGVKLHPEIRFFLAIQLAQAGRKDVAGSLVADWPSDEEEPQDVEIDDFLAAAAAIGDPAFLLTKLTWIAERRSWPRTAAALAGGVLDIFGPDAFRAVRLILDAPRLAERPILAARVALMENNPALATEYIAEFRRRNAGERQQASGLALLRSIVPDHRALDIFSDAKRAEPIQDWIRHAMISPARAEQPRAALTFVDRSATAIRRE